MIRKIVFTIIFSVLVISLSSNNYVYYYHIEDNKMLFEELSNYSFEIYNNIIDKQNSIILKDDSLDIILESNDRLMYNIKRKYNHEY